ncbi:MAG: hypothetical protein ACOX6T_13290 [Myxococcales bacterium]|jgi:hypothetical protein
MTKITRNRNDSASTPRTQDRAAEEARKLAEARRQAEAARRAAEPQARARNLASGFERGRRREDANRLLGGGTAASLQQTAANLAAESAFAKLAQRPDAKGVLEKLGIRDGASLQGFGMRLAREATMGGQTRGGDVALATVARQTSPETFAEIVQAAAATLDGSIGATLANPQFAHRVAAGENPRAVAESLSAGEKPTAAALAKLGLTEADLMAAGKDALPVLSEAGKLALAGDFAGAIKALAGLGAAAAPLAEKAIAHLAKQLPAGPARTLLTDSQLVHALVTNPEVHAALGKLAHGDLAGAARDLADTKALRDRLVELIAREPTVKVQLEKLGVSVEDLKLAGAALPDLLEAANAAAAGDTKAALAHLVAAAKDAAILAERAILTNAKKLPEGLAKSLLTDPAVVHDLVSDPKLHSALGRLVAGDPKAALETLAGDTRLMGHVIDVVVRQPKVKEGLSALGITAADLKAAGKGLPELIDAAELAAKGDLPGAAAKLGEAAKDAAPVIEKAVLHLAKKLPEGLPRTLLTDPKVVRELVRNPELHEAYGKLLKGDGLGALEGLLDNATIRNRVLDVVAADARIAAGMSALGLTAADLRASGGALPRLIEAADLAGKGDLPGAATKLGEAAKEAAPVIEKAVLHLAQKLPEGLPRTLLTDPKVVSELVRNPELHEAYGKLIKGDGLGALEGLLDNATIRNRVLDLVAADARVAAGMSALGLTAADLRASGGALPRLIEAAGHATNGDPKAALEALVEAAEQAAPAVEKAIVHIAGKLPAGPARTLLTDAEVVHDLVTNRDLHASIKQLVSGDASAGIQGLLGNATVRDHAIEALASDPSIRKVTDGLGLTVDDLKSAGAALPHLYTAADAVARGDTKAALEALAEAAKEAAPAIEKAIVHVAGKLPAGPARTLLTDAAVVHDLVTNSDLHASIKQLASGDASEGIQGLLSNATVRDHVIDALARDPSIQKLTDKLGLTVDDLKTAGAALPHLFAAADAAARGDTKAALAALGEAAKTSVPLAEKAVKGLAAKLPATGAAGILRSALTDAQVVHDLLTDSNFHSAIGKLVDGDIAGALQSLGKARNVRDHLIDALAKNPTVAAGLQKIGLTATDLKQAGDALPEIFGAVQDAAAGELQLALRHLGEAAKKAPSLVEKAIIAVASKLPDDGPAGMAKALFTDPEFVSTIVENKDVHRAFQRMVSGEFTDGLGELLGNKVICGKVAEVLANNPTIKKVLAPLGITSAKDIAAIGAALPTVMELASDIKGGRVGEAFQDLGQILGELPPDLRSRMVGNLADKLKLPTWAKDVAVTVAGLLGNKEVAQSFAEAVEAFQRGDVKGFVAGLADTAQTIAVTNPELAKAFLNSLSRLPGSFGKLFASPELNEMVVESGSIEHVFAAAKKLANGDVGGALEELGNSFKDLLSAGKPIKIAGQELPIGEDGLKALGLMFERFIDALPDKVKAKIAEATAKMAAKVGLSAVPVIGDIVGGAADAWDLVQAIKNGESGFDIAMAAAKVALDIAGAFQVVKPFTVPLKMAIGAAQVVKTTADIVESVQEFQEEFAGLAA